MIAKPAVEPSARCELRIPDAMPDRSGGIDPIASLVADGTASPPAAPTNASPRSATHTCDASLAARIPVPMTTVEMPTSVGRRAPRAATMRPLSGERTIVGIVIANIRKPVFSGLYSRTFWKYCVMMNSVP